MLKAEKTEKLLKVIFLLAFICTFCTVLYENSFILNILNGSVLRRCLNEDIDGTALSKDVREFQARAAATVNVIN